MSDKGDPGEIRNDFELEPDLLPGRTATVYWVATVVSTVVVVLIAWGLLRIFSRGPTEGPQPTHHAGYLEPKPQRQPYTWEDLPQGPDPEARIRLNSWLWVDRQRRLATIPVDRAMALMAADTGLWDRARAAMGVAPVAQGFTGGSPVGAERPAAVQRAMQGGSASGPGNASGTGGAPDATPPTRPSASPRGSPPAAAPPRSGAPRRDTLTVEEVVLVQRRTAPPLADSVARVDERPGARLPLDASFVDAGGRPLRLGDLLAGHRPLLLVPGWYRCRTLCGPVLDGIRRSSAAASGWSPGRDFDVVAVSIDPREGPAEARARSAELFGPGGPPAGWHFLSGGEDAIRAVAEAVGFRYRWDARDDQFAHLPVAVAVGPDGRVARYVYGVDPHPDTLAAALAAARDGNGAFTRLARAMAVCFRPTHRRHAVLVATVVEGGGLAILLSLAALLVWARRREKEARA